MKDRTEIGEKLDMVDMSACVNTYPIVDHIMVLRSVACHLCGYYKDFFCRARILYHFVICG